MGNLNKTSTKKTIFFKMVESLSTKNQGCCANDSAPARGKLCVCPPGQCQCNKGSCCCSTDSQCKGCQEMAQKAGRKGCACGALCLCTSSKGCGKCACSLTIVCKDCTCCTNCKCGDTCQCSEGGKCSKACAKVCCTCCDNCKDSKAGCLCSKGGKCSKCTTACGTGCCECCGSCKCDGDCSCSSGKCIQCTDNCVKRVVGKSSGSSENSYLWAGAFVVIAAGAAAYFMKSRN